MSSFALSHIDAAIDLFVSLIQHGGGTPRYQRNLQWLVKLRGQAASKMSATSRARHGDATLRALNDANDEGEDMELLGWRTRLVERAGQNRQTIRTIRPEASPADSRGTNFSDVVVPLNQFEGVQEQLRMAEILTSNSPLPLTAPDLTDDLVSSTYALANFG